MEYRTTGGAVGLRPSPAGGSMVVGTIPFNSMSAPIRSGSGAPFREVISPQAFTRTLRAGGDVVALREHDPGQLLGRSTTGSLRMSVDRTGLRFEVDPPAGVSYSDDMMVLLARGDLAASSFAFRTVEGGDTWSYTDSGMPLRTLVDVDLFDCSIVLRGAYSASTAAILAADPMMSKKMPAMAGGRSSNRLAECRQEALNRNRLDLLRRRYPTTLKGLHR